MSTLVTVLLIFRKWINMGTYQTWLPLGEKENCSHLCDNIHINRNKIQLKNITDKWSIIPTIMKGFSKSPLVDFKFSMSLEYLLRKNILFLSVLLT